MSVLSMMFLLFNCNGLVEIPDPNFNAYLLEHFDTNKDGTISLSEARAVKEMDCSNRSIKSIEGIANFKNLVRLNCSNNLIDELNLSNNKKLKTIVSANHNEQKSFVEIPDPNFKAYLLENFDANKDGEISLLEAKEVKGMNCSNKNMQDITGIEKFVNLESLNCSNNQLTMLDIRENKKINWLVCNNNKDLLTVQFSMSSPLRDRSYQRPSNNTPEISQMTNPIDLSKCVYDPENTHLVVFFDD